MGSVQCEHCTGHCCKYLGLPLETPVTSRDFDDLRWYLMHAGVTIYVEDGDWYVQFATRCRNLLPDNRCAVYRRRPHICREYQAGECDYLGGGYEYDELFTHVEQLEAYAKKALDTHKPRRRKRASRNGRTRLLSAHRRAG